MTHWLPRFSRLVHCARRIGAGCLLGLALTGTITAEPLLAQDFLVHNWDVDEGLPSTCVNSVARTPDGYVWLGTRRGLVRFDGLRFVIFNLSGTPVLKDNRIISLTTDRQGSLWIGTENGNLSKLEKGVFTAVDLGSATHQTSITSIAFDREGRLWLATAGAGLIHLQTDKMESFTSANGLPSQTIHSLLADAQDRIWYIAAPGILGWMEHGKCHVVGNAGKPPAWIRTITRSQDGGLWVAAQEDARTGTRIFKFKDGQFTEPTRSYPWPEISWRSRPDMLLEDQSHNLWCGTSGAGVYFRPVNGPWQQLVADLPFSQAETKCLVEDEKATVWIGTRTAGLYQAVPSTMSAYDLPLTNNQNVVLTVCVRHDGSVWGGTDGAGIFRWRDPATNRFAEPQGLVGLQVNALLEDSRSNFWAGTSAGLFHFQAGQFEPDEKLADLGPVNSLHEDKSGNIWAGTLNGLICVTGPEPQEFNSSNGLPNGTIVAFTQDSTGRFWVAIRDTGVFRQNGSRFSRWLPKLGTAAARQNWGNGENVRSLVPDADGSIWVATHGDGLFRLSGNQICSWRYETDGLPSNHQFALLLEGGTNLWISSENGIFGYAKQALLDYQAGNIPPVPWRLTHADGLPYKFCSGGGQPTATCSTDGRLWFPDSSALVVFDPASRPRRLQIYPPVIEQVRADNQLFPGIAGHPFRIASSVRSLEFYFTSPNILLPTHLQFQYRLNGLEKDWVPSSTLRSAQYSRLPPGDYTFQVMAADNYGVWNKKPPNWP